MEERSSDARRSGSQVQRRLFESNPIACDGAVLWRGSVCVVVCGVVRVGVGMSFGCRTGQRRAAGGRF